MYILHIIYLLISIYSTYINRVFNYYIEYIYVITNLMYIFAFYNIY